MTAIWRQARPRIRDLAGDLLGALGITKPERFARNKLSIVTFHRVLPEPLFTQYPIPSIAVTPEELDHVLGVFQEHYTPGPLIDVATRYESGERPAKPFLAVTFDDGQRDNLTYAHPVLTARGIAATFFVVAQAAERNETLWHDRVAFALVGIEPHKLARVGPLLDQLSVARDADDLPNVALAAAKALTPEARGAWVAKLEQLTGGPARPDWDGIMSWPELRTLKEAGHEIGSHSSSHALLPQVADTDLHAEIAGSRRVIAENLGGDVSTFCYPNGDHDGRVVDAVARAGYRFAVTTRYGLNRHDSAPLTLKRCDVQGRFARDASGALASAGILLRLTGRQPGAA